MNHLNSVLIEGTVFDEPMVYMENGVKACSFILVSVRREGANKTLKRTGLCVVCRGEVLVYAVEHIRFGCGVRVVGRLNSTCACAEAPSGLHVVAEHIEYRKESDGKKKEGRQT